MLIYISFKKWLFISFVHLTNWFIFSLLSLSFLHILKTNPFEMYNLHVFSGFLWVSTSLKVSLSGTNVFNFHEVYFMFFFSFAACFWYHLQKVLPNSREERITSVFSYKSVTVLPLTFSFVMYFECIQFFFSCREGCIFLKSWIPC